MKSFNSSALYNALMSDPDSFVRVDAGTYALAEWGHNRVATYPDITSSILKSHRKSLPSETIFSKVNEVRPIKPVTLTMLLDLHPRFYRSLEKTYGLKSGFQSVRNKLYEHLNGLLRIAILTSVLSRPSSGAMM